jgi:tetratricopeptide (TPR) repeat protein
VEATRAGDLAGAAAHFESAQKLNPTTSLRRSMTNSTRRFAPASRARGFVPSRSRPFRKIRGWNEVLNENGPFDEPSFCFEQGLIFANQSGLFRQSIALFERVRELDPDYLPARLQLAASYLVSRLPDRALDALREPLEQPEKFSLTEDNSTQLNLLAAAAYFQKNDTARGTQLIETEISRHPTNDDLLVTAAKAYLAHKLFQMRLVSLTTSLNPLPTTRPGFSAKATFPSS